MRLTPVRLRAGGRAARLPALLAALSLFTCGCGLGPIERDTCGNGVVEIDNHEDCDRDSPSCGSKTSAAPCRFLCESDAECSPGYHCGTDRVCRRPRGVFAELMTRPNAETIGLAAGRLNADGCDELVLSTVSQEVIEGFASRAPGHCEALHHSFRASLVPSETPFAAPVFGGSDSARELIVVDRGHFGEGLFELEIVGDDLVSRAHIGTPLRSGDGPLNTALATRLGLDDGSDAWLAIGASVGPPSMGPPPMEPSALFALRYPSANAEVLDAMFPASLGVIVALASGDLQAGGCEELVYAVEKAPSLRLLSICPATPSGEAWLKTPLPDIKLAGGAKLPAASRLSGMPNIKSPPSSTSLVLVDADGDSHIDVLINDDSGHIHIAYGLGDGQFHSQSPPSAPPDQTTSVLADVSDWGITGDYVFAAWPGGAPGSPAPHAVVLPLACPTRTPFALPSCSMQRSNTCSATTGDVDGNGRPDVVFTEPQIPSFLVYRGTAAGGFALSSHPTPCPPRRLNVADLDSDGLDDIAFFDAKATSASSGGAVVVDSIVKVAFGSPAGPPESPRLVAVFDPGLGRPSSTGLGRDQALVAGRFLTKASGNQLAAVTSLPGPSGEMATDSGLAAARLESAASRRMVAPFYFPNAAAGGAPDKTLRVHQMVRGAFAGSSGLAVITTGTPDDASALESLWLLDTSVSALLKKPTPLSINQDCKGCSLATIDLEGDGTDELVSLGEGFIAIYRAASELGFGEPVKLPTAFNFRSGKDVLWGQPPLPVVADLDGDARPDILAMTASGELVAAWGTGGAAFDITKLLDPQPCPDGPTHACTGRSGFAVLELDGSALPEVVVSAPGLLDLYDIRADRTLDALGPLRLDSDKPQTPPDFTNFTALVTGDFDGDGVDDIALARASSFFTVLRGLPEIE